MQLFNLELNDNISNILIDFYKYLLTNDKLDFNALDYIFSIIEDLGINKNYLSSINIDYNLPTNGAYFYEKQNITINPKILRGMKQLNYIDLNQFIIEFLILIFHEINHVYQKMHIDNLKDDRSKILLDSIMLKNRGIKYLNEFRNLFPDEIDSNIKSLYLVYDFLSKYFPLYTEYVEHKLVNTMVIDLMQNKNIINSQYNYIYNLITQENIKLVFPKLSEYENVSYGLEKKQITLDILFQNYQMQKMHFDIRERRK